MMRLLTPFLLRFALIACILTLIFRLVLSHQIDHELQKLVILSSVLYGSAMFIAGWYFGKKDNDYLPIFDLGFRFHLATYLVHNGISLLWMLLGFSSEKESPAILSQIAAFWGVFLIIHFIVFLIAKKRTINNLDKDNLFD